MFQILSNLPPAVTAGRAARRRGVCVCGGGDPAGRPQAPSGLRRLRRGVGGGAGLAGRARALNRQGAGDRRWSPLLIQVKPLQAENGAPRRPLPQRWDPRVGVIGGCSWRAYVNRSGFPHRHVIRQDRVRCQRGLQDRGVSRLGREGKRAPLRGHHGQKGVPLEPGRQASAGHLCG